jgi:hypothetical protein
LPLIPRGFASLSCGTVFFPAHKKIAAFAYLHLDPIA